MAYLQALEAVLLDAADKAGAQSKDAPEHISWFSSRLAQA